MVLVLVSAGMFKEGLDILKLVQEKVMVIASIRGNASTYFIPPVFQGTWRNAFSGATVT